MTLNPELNINLASFQIKAIDYPSENHRLVHFAVWDLHQCLPLLIINFSYAFDYNYHPLISIKQQRLFVFMIAVLTGLSLTCLVVNNVLKFMTIGLLKKLSQKATRKLNPWSTTYSKVTFLVFNTLSLISTLMVYKYINTLPFIMTLIVHL